MSDEEEELLNSDLTGEESSQIFYSNEWMISSSSHTVSEMSGQPYDSCERTQKSRGLQQFLPSREYIPENVDPSQMCRSDPIGTEYIELSVFDRERDFQKASVKERVYSNFGQARSSFKDTPCVIEVADGVGMTGYTPLLHNNNYDDDDGGGGGEYTTHLIGAQSLKIQRAQEGCARLWNEDETGFYQNEASDNIGDTASNFTVDHENVNRSNIRQDARRRVFVNPAVDRFNVSNSAGQDDESPPSSSSGSPSDSSKEAANRDTGGDEADKSSSVGTSSIETSPSGGGSPSGSSGSSSSTSTSSGSSGSSSSSSSSKKKKKKVKKRHGFWGKLMRSSPDEQKLLKAVLWFPVGIGLSLIIYYLVIDKMKLVFKTKALIGGAIGLVLSLTFAFSIQMRCTMCLVIPTFVGKAGRSYIAAFAMVYLINGPITNLMDNSKEIVRSLTCTSELLANHTREKWKFRLAPVTNAFGDLAKDGFYLKKVAKRIEKAFIPVKKEIQDNMRESRRLEKHIKKVEKMTDSKEETVEKIEKEHKDDDKKLETGKKIEKQWEKKLDLRCQDTFSQGVQRCRDAMGKLEDKCMDALWIIGYLLCWPLKITVFCQLVRLMPGVFGMSCKSMDVVNPGFGETYADSAAVVDDMDQGMEVQMQYKVVGTADFDYTPVEEMRQATIHEVSRKTDILGFFFSMIAHILTFTFLIVFKGAYNYNRKFLTDIGFDNHYITKYYRHIDARRKAQDKKTLLPLKKYEKKEYVDPAKPALTKSEKGQFTKGTFKLLLRVVISAIICYMDSLLYQVLDIIAENSRIEYHQEGRHVVDIRVYGNGFMSALVRMFLTKFNTNHTLDKVTTNHDCLPNPSQTDIVVISFIFITYILVWIFMYFEAFGLRLRRVIASFFYRKREKKRVLYLYNDMFRKRIGYLRHMRGKIRKALRARELKKKVGLIMALQRTFPRLCGCLKVFKSSKDNCIICNEPEGEGFHKCPRPGCGIGYCKECWIDVKRKCYACGEGEGSSDSDSDQSTASDLSEESD